MTSHSNHDDSDDTLKQRYQRASARTVSTVEWHTFYNVKSVIPRDVIDWLRQNACDVMFDKHHVVSFSVNPETWYDVLERSSALRKKYDLLYVDGRMGFDDLPGQRDFELYDREDR